MGKLDAARKSQRNPTSFVQVQTRVVGVSAPAQRAGQFQVGSGSDMARMDGTDARWRFWSGGSTGALATFGVDRTGFVKMSSACISGSLITSACIVAGTLTGTGQTAHMDNVAVMDGNDATYRIWAGASAAGSAAFRVDKTGILYATGASISGSISASSGFIGGWTITDRSIESAGSNVVLDSTDKVVAIKDDTPATRAKMGAIGGSYGFQIFDTDGTTELFGIYGSTANIAGWNFTPTQLTGGSVTLDASGSIKAGSGNAAVYIDPTQATWFFFIGNQTPTSAPFRVDKDGNFIATSGSLTGDIVSTAGSIGGWDIGATTLSGGDITLDSSGFLKLGTGDNVVRIDAADATYRIWAGASAAGSATFSVTKGGIIYAKGGSFDGTLSASIGSIGGWTIGATTLVGGDATLASSGSLGLGTGDNFAGMSAVDATYRLWIGASAAGSAAFSVTKDGSVKASGSIDVSEGGTVGGWSVGSACIMGGDATLHSSGYLLLGTGDNIARIDAADATYRLWVGASSAGSATFSVTKGGIIYAKGGSFDGDLSASTGTIGGWSIGATTLVGGDATLASSGSLGLGTGDNFAGMSAVDGTYRLWVGASAAGSATFSVTKAGLLLATGASITGSINATGGQIGGWSIGSASLVGGDATLHSSGYLSLGTGNNLVRLDATDATYRLWVGNATASNAPFSVTKAGVVYAKGGSFDGTLSASVGLIGGWVIGASTLTGGNVKLDASGSISIGATGGVFLKLLGGGPQIESSNYNSGYSGFHLSPSLLEVQNIVARGMIRTAVFQKDVVSTVGGNLLVLDGDILAASVSNTGTTITITGSTTFKTNDILRIKSQTASGVIIDEWMTVSSSAAAPDYTVVRNAGTTGCGNWPLGTAVVNYGPSGCGGTLLTSSLTNSPYISIFTHAGAPWTTITEHARLGYLGGISGASGWGLWTDNGFFEGQITSACGTIGNWAIGADTLTGGDVKLDASGSIFVGSGNDSVTLDATQATWFLFAGNTTPTSAPFRVSKAGALVATSASIEGSVSATEGAIGGWTIGTATLVGGDVTLASSGSLGLGTGDNFAGVSAVDATYRLWVGASAAGSATFSVTKAGALLATGASITGSINATGGQIGGWSIGSASLTGGDAKLHSSGYLLLGTGDNVIRLDATDATYRLWIGASAAGSANLRITKGGIIYAKGGSFDGTLSASVGTIGGWTITGTELHNTNLWLDAAAKQFAIASQTFGADGIQLEYNSGNPRFYAGNGASQFFKFDGTNLSWNANNTFLDTAGNFKATSASIEGSISATEGAIGGWTIGAATLTGGDATLASSGSLGLGTGDNFAGISAVDATYRFWVGASNAGSATFRVTKGGALVATNASILGSVNASEGAIGGWTLGADTLTGGNVKLDASGSILVGTGNNVVTLDATQATWFLSAGNATPANAPFRVSKAGVLVATTGSFTGDIFSTAGSIGGFTLGASLLQSLTGRLEISSASDNEYLVIKDATPVTRAKIGRIGTTYGLQVFESDGTTELFGIYGSVANIGGWAISSSQLTSGNINLDASGSVIVGTGDSVIVMSSTDASYRFWTGASNSGSAKIRFDTSGQMNIRDEDALGTTGVSWESKSGNLRGYIQTEKSASSFVMYTDKADGIGSYIQIIPGTTPLMYLVFNDGTNAGQSFRFQMDGSGDPDFWMRGVTNASTFAQFNVNGNQFRGKLGVNMGANVGTPTNPFEVWDGSGSIFQVTTAGDTEMSGSLSVAGNIDLFTNNAVLNLGGGGGVAKYQLWFDGTHAKVHNYHHGGNWEVETETAGGVQKALRFDPDLLAFYSDTSATLGVSTGKWGDIWTSGKIYIGSGANDYFTFNDTNDTLDFYVDGARGFRYDQNNQRLELGTAGVTRSTPAVDIRPNNPSWFANALTSGQVVYTTRRGIGMGWKGPSTNAAFANATFHIPENYMSGNISIKATLKKWSGASETVSCLAYVDSLVNGTAIPADVTGTVTTFTVNTSSTVVTLYSGAASGAALAAGNSVLITFSLYNIVSGNELQLHDIWLEYTAYS